MKRRSRQRGVALLALIAVLVIGGTWYLVSRLQQLSANRTATERVKNAAVLNRAKQALIGYVIAQANHAGENNPGALPCPEAGAYFNSTTGNDGKVASSCSLPAVGRFPWRTLGTDKFVDAAGEPLWYVVSPGWAYNGSSTTINSNSAGQLTVDSVTPASLATADTVIALIIAPGLPFSVPAATGCTAYSQARPQTSGVAPDVRNYLECDNATSGDSSFVTTGPSGSFNDQVLKVTVGDLMPGLEAAVADRVARSGEFFDTFKTVYPSGTSWGLSAAMYPFAAPFANPSTSTLQGTVGTYAGLLPVTITETSPGSGVACTGTEVLPCAANFVAWTGTPTLTGRAGTTLYSTDCSATTSTQVNCTFYSQCTLGLFACLLGGTATLSFSLTATATNVGMSLRQLYPAVSMTNVDTGGRSATGSMNSNGSAAITLTGTTTVTYSFGAVVGNLLCAGLATCETATISVPIRLVGDHALLDTSTAASYGWFLRNKWHQMTYYAVAQNYTPAGAPNPSCTNGTTCLTVTNPPATGGAAGAQRAIAIMMGRGINGNTRPSATLADYLEYGNVGASYENQNVRDSVRNVLTDTGGANAYAVSQSAVVVGKPIYFRATNTNTGASTLSTAATGVKNLVNSDGSALSASQIRANNAVLVTYDGTQFVLATKRPFNDRVLVIDHN